VAPQAKKRTESLDKLESQVRSNVAAILLERGSHTQVLFECRQALRLWSGNVRACQRAAKACIELGKASDALDYCEVGLALEPDNKVRGAVTRGCWSIPHVVVTDAPTPTCAAWAPVCTATITRPFPPFSSPPPLPWSVSGESE
jgi:hypothetical protein